MESHPYTKPRGVGPVTTQLTPGAEPASCPLRGISQAHPAHGPVHHDVNDAAAASGQLGFHANLCGVLRRDSRFRRGIEAPTIAGRTVWLTRTCGSLLPVWKRAAQNPVSGTKIVS